MEEDVMGGGGMDGFQGMPSLQQQQSRSEMMMGQEGPLPGNAMSQQQHRGVPQGGNDAEMTKMMRMGGGHQGGGGNDTDMMNMMRGGNQPDMKMMGVGTTQI